LHSYLQSTGRCTYLPVTDREALDSAIELTKLEGIIPALESAHALALLPKFNWLPGEHIVIILSGRGDKDMDTYSKNFNHESH
jgi:tryptophan synthase beta chain